MQRSSGARGQLMRRRGHWRGDVGRRESDTKSYRQRGYVSRVPSVDATGAQYCTGLLLVMLQQASKAGGRRLERWGGHESVFCRRLSSVLLLFYMSLGLLGLRRWERISKGRLAGEGSVGWWRALLYIESLASTPKAAGVVGMHGETQQQQQPIETGAAD